MKVALRNVAIGQAKVIEAKLAREFSIIKLENWGGCKRDDDILVAPGEVIITDSFGKKVSIPGFTFWFMFKLVEEKKNGS